MPSTGRKKSEFRQAALKALEITLRAFKDQDHFGAVGPRLIAALQQQEEAAEISTGVSALSMSCIAGYMHKMHCYQ